MDKLIIDNIKIEDMIYVVRGEHVMLDFDLAEFYKCANGTKSINLAVKRHINKFPGRFMFQLTDEESKNIRFQIETKNGHHETRGGKYDKPYAFTEEGVAMLATVLHTKIADEISIKIMDAFVKMRHYIKDNELYKSLNRIDNKIIEHDEKLEYLFSKFDNNNQLFFEGETYDAYSRFIKIFNEAKKELIIVDSYADITLLDIIKRLEVDVILITKNSERLCNNDILKYNSQYNNLKVIRNNSFHDRYLIIDKKFFYQSGASINNAGEKVFSISKIGDSFVKETIIKTIDNIINS